ncbi:hypothetical protein CDL15_Pgr023799 [Punica granatum]|uniref:Uncharacterized protein n=1 Tax=Punica granatum TaxID=22663 RepID=A0A218VZ40_PUNGR|nr:hypothetical protein CDL15_Pgr023799 [Punica granatum]
MIGSVPKSLAGVTHYGDVEANFNQRDPSVCRLLRWMMSEVVSVRALNVNAPVFIVDVTHGQPSVHGSPCHGGRVKAAGDLPVKVGTTRLSCGVGGWDE